MHTNSHQSWSPASTHQLNELSFLDPRGPFETPSFVLLFVLPFVPQDKSNLILVFHFFHMTNHHQSTVFNSIWLTCLEYCILVEFAIAILGTSASASFGNCRSSYDTCGAWVRNVAKIRIVPLCSIGYSTIHLFRLFVICLQSSLSLSYSFPGGGKYRNSNFWRQHFFVRNILVLEV